MTTLALRKLHATGNDFLVLVDLDARFGAPGGRAGPLDEAAIAALCDRATGVGADGLIRLLPGGAGADCTMELHNADGGLAEMSGNGIRCLAWAADRAGITPATAGVFIVDTGGGRRLVSVERDATGVIAAATVDMGPVTFDPVAIPTLAADPFDLAFTFDGVHYRGDAAGMGNPHVVIVVDDPDTFPLDGAGPVFEHDARFPHRTNVEVIMPVPGGIRLRVWERGVGETRSCGTGACAAAAVAHRRGLTGSATTVFVPGGRLDVEIGATISLRGPVVPVFDVEVELETILRSAEAGQGVRP